MVGATGWQPDPGEWSVEELVEPDSLLYYWPYGRHGGINFHPPWAGAD